MPGILKLPQDKMTCKQFMFNDVISVKTPRMPAPKEPVTGWNPKPAQLVPPTKPEEKLDPGKAKKLQELEEQKKRR